MIVRPYEQIHLCPKSLCLMFLNTTADCDLVNTMPVMLLISYASAILAIGMCTVVLCHCCAIVYVFHTQTMGEQHPTIQNHVSENVELCYTCFETQPDTILIACGHRGLCSACAARLWTIDRRCPLCRRAVHGVVFLDSTEQV